MIFFKSIKNYCNIEGRASRYEFWIFILIIFITLILTVYLQGLMLQDMFSKEGPSPRLFYSSIIIGLFLKFLIIPCITVTIRRFHDIGASGWTFLLNIPAIIGIISLRPGPDNHMLMLVLMIPLLYTLYLTLKGSQVGSNKYGKNPKEIHDK